MAAKDAKDPKAKKKRRPQTQAEKRHKQSLKRRLRNRITKKLIKTYTKRALAAVAEKNFEQAEADFRATVRRIDKAGARRVLHPNTAARRKGSLTRTYAAAVAKARGTAAAPAKA